MDSHPFYFSVYGSRWPRLCEAMSQKSPQMARLCFSDEQQFKKLSRDFDLCNEDIVSGFERSWWAGALNQDQIAWRDESSGKLKIYVQDPASVVVASALSESDGLVLDMCAAPGGKSLVLREFIDSESVLVVNEPSRVRRERLKKVLRNYVPETLLNKLSVTGRDGVAFGKQPDTFDAVLVDAPCSGEAYKLAKGELAHWTEKNSRHMSLKQYSLLASALTAAKPGAKIVYSTCSLSPWENGQVVDRLLKKEPYARVCEINLKPEWQLEPCQHGMLFLPDRGGFGPMYFAVLEKC